MGFLVMQCIKLMLTKKKAKENKISIVVIDATKISVSIPD